MTPNRRTIAELAYYVSSNGRGVAGHPVQRAVVEGRDYSRGPGTSCVELPDCCAYAAGCRAPAINRDENAGRHAQTDLGWYIRGSQHDGKILVRPTLEQLTPGDFIGYDFDRGGHAAIYLGTTSDGKALTADYGQWHGGGRLYTCSVASAVGYLLLRGRRVWASVDVDTLTYVEPPVSVGEWCLGHGLELEPWAPPDYWAELWGDA